MDEAKAMFLFGSPPAWADLEDPEDWDLLFSEELEARGVDEEDIEERVALYSAVARQVRDEDPPEVWSTAQRLTGLGLERWRVLSELVLVYESQPGERYLAALERLPLPKYRELREALREVARSQPPMGMEEVVSACLGKLGAPAGEEPWEGLAEEVLDDALDEGDLAILSSDVVVEPASFTSGAVFTHRLSEAEKERGCLEVGVDLAAFSWLEEAELAGGGRLQLASGGWEGPEGWLDAFPAASALAVSQDQGTVSVTALEELPAPSPELVSALRAAYERCYEKVELPVDAEDLAFDLLGSDREHFCLPQAPLSELGEAAGLEWRGRDAGHSPQAWANAKSLALLSRVVGRLPEKDASTCAAVTRTVEVFASGGWGDVAELREATRLLRDPGTFEVLADEVFGLDDDPELAAQAGEWARYLVEAARKPEELAAARLFSAVACERLGDPFGAQAQAHLAVEADPGWAPAVDRLSWYLLDRGDAAGAAELLRSLGLTAEEDDDLAMAEAALGSVGGAARRLGRNEACWCGSGRKYKHCHLGEPALPPLPERAGWLWQKAVSYLERRGGQAALLVEDLAEVLGVDAAGALVSDLALVEGGWFRRFLLDRGPLLPGDEAILAASWALVDRTLYEVVSARPGEGLVVRDLKSADELVVLERTFSEKAAPGMLVCGRAVPDGSADGHQFVGALFEVRAGHENDLLEVLDHGDPWEVAAWVGASLRPPAMSTREGERVVLCRAVLEAPSLSAARAALERGFVQEDEGRWVETHELSPGDSVLRASLRLEGRRVRVETLSEARLDRALAKLRELEPAFRVVALDKRRPAAPGGGLTPEPWE